jgi:hypothetical protein
VPSLIRTLIQLRSRTFDAHHTGQAVEVTDPLEPWWTQPHRLGKRVGPRWSGRGGDARASRPVQQRDAAAYLQTSVESRERFGNQVIEPLVSLLKPRVEVFCLIKTACPHRLLGHRMYLTRKISQLFIEHPGAGNLQPQLGVLPSSRSWRLPPPGWPATSPLNLLKHPVLLIEYGLDKIGNRILQGQQALALEGISLILALLHTLMLAGVAFASASHQLVVHSQHSRSRGAEQHANEAIHRRSCHRR